jgi:hypothetical protein
MKATIAVRGEELEEGTIQIEVKGREGRYEFNET